jgi:hypothetical protein
MSALKLFHDVTELNPIDRKARLKKDEQELEVCLAGYLNAGGILDRMRERRDWYPKWPTFEAYTLQKWGISDGEAYKEIKRAKTAAAVTEAGAAPPPRPAAQALADYADDPKFQKAVWERASEEKEKPTARDIQFHASQLLLEDARNVPVKVQATVARKGAQALSDSAKRAATKEEIADQKEKALRWAGKLVALFREMESSGHFGRSLGLAADMEMVLGKVRVWVG